MRAGIHQAYARFGRKRLNDRKGDEIKGNVSRAPGPSRTVGSLGPKARRMTAEVDAHWINVNFTEEFSAITARNMEAEYRATGRDPAGKRKTIFSFGSVLRKGEGYDS